MKKMPKLRYPMERRAAYKIDVFAIKYPFCSEKSQIPVDNCAVK